MNARACVFVMGAVVLAGIACGKGTGSVDRLGGARSGAELDAVGLCSHEPWTGGAGTTGCGEASIVHDRVTCDELGLGAGVTLVLSAPDASGYRTGSHLDPSGITSRATTDESYTSWSFATTVKPDGSTMTFEALVFSSNGSEDSEVVRFSEPEFYVRNMATTIGTVDEVQLCGYAPGHSSSLPPAPDPHLGPFALDCSGNGGTTAPGPTIRSTADIRWMASVTPTPAASLSQNVFVFEDAEAGAIQSGHEFTLVNDAISGDYDTYFLHAQGPISLRFQYYNATCTMYWNVESGGGQTW